MGTGWQPRAAVLGGRALCHLLAAFKGWHYRSRLVNSLAFGSYNRSFRAGPHPQRLAQPGCKRGGPLPRRGAVQLYLHL